MKTVIILAVCGLVGGVGLWAYVNLINGHMRTYAEAMDKSAQLKLTSGWAWVLAKLGGWKTIVLAWIASLGVVIQNIPADVVQGWTNLPWAQVVDSHIAAWISIVCTMVIPIVHSLGLKNAALTPPAAAPAAGD